MKYTARLLAVLILVGMLPTTESQGAVISNISYELIAAGFGEEVNWYDPEFGPPQIIGDDDVVNNAAALIGGPFVDEASTGGGGSIGGGVGTATVTGASVQGESLSLSIVTDIELFGGGASGAWASGRATIYFDIVDVSAALNVSWAGYNQNTDPAIRLERNGLDVIVPLTIMDGSFSGFELTPGSYVLELEKATGVGSVSFPGITASPFPGFVSVSVVPEASVLTLCALGGLGVVATARRRLFTSGTKRSAL